MGQPTPDDLMIFDELVPVDGEAVIEKLASDVPGIPGNRVTIRLATGEQPPPNIEGINFYNWKPRIEVVVSRGTEIYHIAIAKRDQFLLRSDPRRFFGPWEIFLFGFSGDFDDQSRLLVFEHGDINFSLQILQRDETGRVGTIEDQAGFTAAFLRLINSLHDGADFTEANITTPPANAVLYTTTSSAKIALVDLTHERITPEPLGWKPNQIHCPDALEILENEEKLYEVNLRFPPIDGQVIVSPSSTASDNISYVTPLLNFSDLGPLDMRVKALIDADHADHRQTFEHVPTGSTDVFRNNESIQITALDPDTPHVLITASVLRVLDGGFEQYGVRLLTQPSHPVFITIALSETTGNINAAPPFLRFDETNWAQVQIVTVTSVRDPASDLHYAIFSHSVRSEDEGYDQIFVPNVLVIEVEDLEIVETPAGPEIDLPGGTRTGAFVAIPDSIIPAHAYIEEMERDLIRDTIKLVLREY